MKPILKYLFFLLIVSLFSYLGAEENSRKKTICLNMIVKNEASVITRCLTSLLPIIDYWVIVDTGSTDGTQDVIKSFMASKGIPGELYERPWKDFSYNRNEAMELAKGKADYFFLIDADEYMVYEPGFKLPELDKDFYHVTICHSGSKYARIQLVKASWDCKYVGVLHEVLCPKPEMTWGTIKNAYNMYTYDGVRSRDPQKYQKDAAVFEEALKSEPDNPRYVFYLAQSYRDAKDYAPALKNYEKRVQMGGWDQEVFQAMVEVGRMQELLGVPQEIVINSYKKAFQFRPSRVDPLYYIANYYRRKNDFEAGYKIAKLGMSVPKSDDYLFVPAWIEDYGMAIEYTVCAYWAGHYDECQKASLDLLKKDNLSPQVRQCVQGNLGFANVKLLETIFEKNNPLAEVKTGI